MTFTPQDLEGLVGRQLPGGTLTVEPYEDWLLRDALSNSRVTDRAVHPLWVIAGLQREMGISLEELFAWCGAASADGPLMGESSIEMIGQLEAGEEYGVVGEIIEARRKTGRRSGTFDTVVVALEARDRNAAVVSRACITYIFPRRHVA